MFVVGGVFELIQELWPAIKAEFGEPKFRDWPGWTQGYMFVHPLWFGFVFAVGYGLVVRDLTAESWRVGAGRGALYGGLLFVIGSGPIFALVYASFRVTPELMSVSWVARNLTQYIVAGAGVGATDAKFRRRGSATRTWL